jgi:tRNA(fMet)-specific endonuclease VapC
LDKQGLVLGDNDLWIAATALNLGAVLVTRDRDFRHVPGLTVEDWTT